MNRAVISLIIAGVLSAVAIADEKDLNGTWTAVSGTNAGEKVSDDRVKDASIVFENGKYTLSFLGTIVDNGTIKIDRSKTPNTIDFISDHSVKNSNVGKKGPMLGVFKLDGDSLTTSFNSHSETRPTDLTSTAENKNFVVIYERKK